jgi:aspartate/methionine/tyrosine aminotransferase
MRLAREAVAAYYADHNAESNPDSLVLTTSTSEGYGYLFRLLCDADDEVLVAQPSYPLFDFLANLEDVRLRPYPLFYDYGWWIDFAELERRVTPRTRAIVLVNPNNPTGHGTSLEERQRLEEICRRHQLALIVDEVFLDYPLSTTGLESFARGPHPILTLVLSGMSKIAGLPQMKVAWIAVFGPEQDRKSALERLEVIADTFLSMNAPAQFALPRWLQGRKKIQEQILQRAVTNFAAIKTSALDPLRTEAGWSAVIRLPRIGIGAQDLLEHQDIIVHPGAFYGMAEAERIVISLIGHSDQFADALQRIRTAVS